MKYVLATTSGGIINQMIYFDDGSKAIYALSEFVKTMDIEEDDAAVYSPDGILANAKGFLDENERYVDNSYEFLEILELKNRPIYIIGNPHHKLGFIVASPDDPLGYDDPVEALSELGQMRKDHGIHLQIYQVIPVAGLVINRAHLEQHNKDCGVEDFNYSIIKEYLLKI
ncbi:hypothetical protein ACFL03_15830 [Thermodesulfobacteriota bacterium]